MADAIPSDAHAIIIGAMRSGTSSLFSYLAAHPQICRSSIKEPEFFSDRQRHKAQVEHYSDLWEFDASIHRYALEASTGYSKYPFEKNVPANMRDYGIRPRMIYVVRDPCERALSQLNFLQQRGRIKAVKRVTDGHVIDTSNYFLQLEQYRGFFPPEEILIVDFADLKAKPEAVLRRIYSFLEISDDFFPPKYAVRNRTRDTKLERRLHEKGYGRLMQRAPEPLKRLGKAVSRMVSPGPQTTLTESEREWIHNTLRDDMVRLHETYGVDVAQWGF